MSSSGSDLIDIKIPRKHLDLCRSIVSAPKITDALGFGIETLRSLAKAVTDNNPRRPTPGDWVEFLDDGETVRIIDAKERFVRVLHPTAGLVGSRFDHIGEIRDRPSWADKPDFRSDITVWPGLLAE